MHLLHADPWLRTAQEGPGRVHITGLTQHVIGMATLSNTLFMLACDESRPPNIIWMSDLIILPTVHKRLSSQVAAVNMRRFRVAEEEVECPVFIKTCKETDFLYIIGESGAVSKVTWTDVDGVAKGNFMLDEKLDERIYDITPDPLTASLVITTPFRVIGFSHSGVKLFSLSYPPMRNNIFKGVIFCESHVLLLAVRIKNEDDKTEVAYILSKLVRLPGSHLQLKISGFEPQQIFSYKENGSNGVYHRVLRTRIAIPDQSHIIFISDRCIRTLYLEGMFARMLYEHGPPSEMGNRLIGLNLIMFDEVNRMLYTKNYISEKKKTIFK